MAFIYFDVVHAVQVHDDIIEKSGGAKGTINIGMLESSFDHVQNDFYYPTLEEKVAHIFYSVNKNHSFADGNKRSSIALAAYFLELNNGGFIVGKFIREMENVAVDVADNRIDKDLLLDIVTSIIYEEDYPDELKLKIIAAKSKATGEVWEA